MYDFVESCNKHQDNQEKNKEVLREIVEHRKLIKTTRKDN